MRAFTQSARSSTLTLPAAVPSMTPTVSSPSVSASPGGATHSNPLRSTNSTMVRKAARLFPVRQRVVLDQVPPQDRHLHVKGRVELDSPIGGCGCSQGRFGQVEIGVRQ